jgi:two-component system, OmpR family, response regulator VicR
MTKKIVVVDDQLDMLKLIKPMLSRKGYEVETDQTGAILDHLENQLPDLIILDINLQIMDGAEICKRLKTEVKTRNIPIILISAVMDLPKISKECGAEGYLAKPFTGNDLISKVQTLLQAA